MKFVGVDRKILTDLIDEYIESHRETLDLLSKPEWVEIIGQGKEEVSKGIKGKGLGAMPIDVFQIR